MNIILGGGLTALLARDILGDNWTIIPIGKSRFYSFNPPLADNYVVRDDIIDEYMQRHTAMPLMYRIGYSLGGQILFNTNMVLNQYLAKLYGDMIPPQAGAYWKDRIDYFGSGNCVVMYNELREKFKSEIAENNVKFGMPSGISDHTITTDKGKFNYSKIISTIPLPVLLKWMNITWPGLKSNDEYCYHVRSDCLDFEGATHLFVVDPEIEFHKATMLNRLNYIFYAKKRIEYPGRYFMAFVKRFELIAETTIEDSMCYGPIPEIAELGEADITCIGSSAVWDDCLDIGSCIKRLVKFGD